MKAGYRSVFAPCLLAGQVVLVTGGGSGIGRCTAHELASLGAHVVLVGRKPDKLQTTATEIVADGGRASFHACDIRQEDAVRHMV
ncbi:MAG: SDR family NAD(P)-dependent oxidoreductase, partial [Hydrogenophaga sp.]|nr:SDR family NAD(P)-dependent oxidoreductase [Hydrogenophaga sp.]